MKRTRILGGLLAAFAVSCWLAGSNALVAGHGKGGKSSDPVETPKDYAIYYFDSGQASTIPHAMNESADIVGYASWNHSFLYSFTNNKMVDLKDKFNSEELNAPDGNAITYDGPNGNGWLVTNAPDINDAGQILCIFTHFNGGQSDAAYGARYTPGSTDAAPRLDFLESPSDGASAMNNQGDVVGGGYLWTDAQPLNQDGWLTANTLPHSSDGVNDDDGSGNVQVIGDNRRYTVNVNSLGVTNDIDLGSSKNYYTNYWAKCINDRGDVAGVKQKWASQETYRYLAQDGNVSLLGAYGQDLSWPGGMNNYGDIAGTYQTSTGEYHLFLYSDVLGGMTDLSAKFPGASLANGSWGPSAMNDHEEICGFTHQPDGGTQGFILVPVKDRSSW